MNIDSLIQDLHEASVSCGEILSAEYVADIVQRFEFAEGIVVSPQDILRATREAADQCCDSYIGNAYDSRSDWGDERVDEEVARWEAQRPAKVRRKQIEAILLAPAVEAAAKERLKNRNKVQRRIDNGYLNPELKKATVRSIARDAVVLNVITLSDFDDVCRILDDRKQCAEDALSEVQDSLNARSKA